MSLGVYVHIPFCAAKCRYCDFNSHVSDENERERYVTAVCNEIESFKSEDMSVDTIYFGGGTPTVLEAEQLEKILLSVYKTFDVCNDCEITTECNPATMNEDGFKILKKAGFNRVSMGVQSANDEELDFLGRIHKFSDCEKCVEDAGKAGFENISLDLMFGLPKQTTASWKKTLESAVKLEPKHLSCYGLKIEEGTPFYSMKINVDEDVSRDMYDICEEYLIKNGYKMYEISNFAKDGFESRHNIKYWRCCDYKGFGTGAYSCLNGIRYSNISNTDLYIKSDEKVADSETLTVFDRMSEYVFLGLRMTEGISVGEFAERFGKSIYDVFGKQIEKNLKRGTVIQKEDRLYIPNKYLYVSNAMLVDFV